jgi:hypothetical protein
MVLGLVVGVVSGLAQLYLLFRFTKAVTAGGIDLKCVALGLAQFFIPFAVLLLSAFLIRRSLLWVGVGIAAALVVGSIILFIRIKGRGRNG